MKASCRSAAHGPLLHSTHKDTHPGRGVAARRARPGQQRQQLCRHLHATADAPEPAGADDSEDVQVSGDWRAFQASLIKQQFSKAGAGSTRH